MKAKQKYNQGKTVKLQISARVEKKYSHWTALVANPSPSQSNSWIQNFLHKTPRGNSQRNLVRKKTQVAIRKKQKSKQQVLNTQVKLVSIQKWRICQINHLQILFTEQR